MCTIDFVILSTEMKEMDGYCYLFECVECSIIL